jgi:hypothetical protein
MRQSSSSESPSAAPPAKPKVIYVMGAGRSGSTILGVTLGNCVNIFYGGELDKWLMRSGLPKRDGAERARFWATVGENVNGPQELFGRDAHQYIERSSSLFRLSAFSMRRRLRARYRRVTEELFRAIAHTAEATHVVDTAHYPLRARELQRLDGIELYIILLVRDPQSIVASFERDDVPEARFSARTTNAYLWLTYLLSLSVFLRHPSARRVLLRHEDFLADPEGVLAIVLEQVDSPAAIPDLRALSTGFPLQGNRLIHSDVVTLQSGRPSPAGGSRLTRLLQLPWALVFSRLRPAARAGGDPE